MGRLLGAALPPDAGESKTPRAGGGCLSGSVGGYLLECLCGWAG